jgi:hypothetical protein
LASPSLFNESSPDPMTVRAILFAAAVSLPTAAMSGDPPSLAGDALRNAVSGKTVYLKISGFELPIRYTAGGRMSGKMGSMAAALSRGDGASDSGRWWIEANRLCQRWSSWMDGKSYCYKFILNGNSLRWVRNDGRSGTARIGG